MKPSDNNSDPTLEVIVALSREMSEKTEGMSEQGLTLQMSGMLVSGIVITQKEYFLSHPFLESVDEALMQISKHPDVLKELPESSTFFIHLKNAYFYHPGNSPLPTSKEGVFWRGRIDRVDAFTLGHLIAS